MNNNNNNCIICNMIFTSNKELINHQSKLSHKKKVEKITSSTVEYKCSHCNKYVTHDLGNFKKHELSCLQKAKTCLICPNIDFNDLKSHLKSKQHKTQLKKLLSSTSPTTKYVSVF